jgi:hypothetical protein
MIGSLNDRPFTLTRPSPIQLRASVREPRPAFDSARSSVLSGLCFIPSYSTFLQ